MTLFALPSAAGRGRRIGVGGEHAVAREQIGEGEQAEAHAGAGEHVAASSQDGDGRSCRMTSGMSHA